jgi:tetratricopeptide (TPR) repeat protein
MRRSPIFWPIIALSVLLVLATATAVQPQLSLWGSYERGQGLSTQLAYVSLFLLVAGYLRTLAQARCLVSAIVWPGAFLVAVGLLQAVPVALDFLLGEAVVGAAGRQLLPLVSDARSPVYGTLGRSNFLGAYLALLLPLTLALLFTGRQRRQRTIMSVLLVGQVAVLAMTLARNAGLAALVGVVLFALLWQGADLARRWRRSAWIGLAMMALSGPLANLTNNLVSFDVTATATWLLMGMVIALDQPARPLEPTLVQPRPFWQHALFSLLALAVALAAFVTNGRILLADAAAHRADQYSHAGQRELAADSAARAVVYWPMEPVYYHDLARHQWQQALQSETPWLWISQTEATLLTACNLRPQDPAMWAELGAFYAGAASEFGAGTRPHAHQAYRQAAALAPNHATLYVARGHLYLEDGDLEAAAVLLRQAVRLDASDSLAYQLLAKAELGLGQVDAAMAAYREAVRLQPESK